MKKLLLVYILLISSGLLYANVSLPKLFADHMVLQRDRNIAVWGWADANERIVVQFRNQTKTTKAGKDGKWMIKLGAETAGGPYTLLVKGNNAITINDVLIGINFMNSAADTESDDRESLEKLPFTISELVSSSPCRSSDGILYTGKKIDEWITINAVTGERVDVLNADTPMCPSPRMTTTSPALTLPARMAAIRHPRDA